MKLAVVGISLLSIASSLQVTSLYDSSDPERSWPPEGKDFSGSPSGWPGQGQRFGEPWPRMKVKDYPYRPEKQDFVKLAENNEPVVVGEGVLRLMTSETGFGLSSEKLLQSGITYLTFLDVIKGNTGQVKEEMSFTKLIEESQGDNPEQMHFIGPLHRDLKPLIDLPSFVNCRDLRKHTFDTKHTYVGFDYQFPLTRNRKLHQFHCQIEGVSEILFVSKKNFPTWKDLKPKKDSVSADEILDIDLQRIDYEKTPELKDIKKFRIARVEAGRCIFIPAGWIYQVNVLEMSHAVGMRWEKESETDCDPVGFDSSFGRMTWKGEEVVEETKEYNRFEVFSTLTHLWDKYVFKFDGKSEFEHFVSLMKKDNQFIEQLYGWNDEATLLTKRLFDKLDLNQDGQLSVEDLRKVRQDDVVSWGLNVLDSRHDLKEVAADLLIDEYMTRPDMERFIERGENLVRVTEYNEKEERRKLKMERERRKRQNKKDEL